MIKMKIEIPDDILRMLEARLSMIAGGALPATSAALKEAADTIRDVWAGYVTGAKDIGIEPLKNPQGGLARTIHSRKTGPLHHEVYSDSNIMGYLIDGTSEVDMKETHTKGPRSRVSKKGVPYLIVPFRWGTPKTVGFRNVLPVAIYDIVKKTKFKRSLVAQTTHNEPNAKGEAVERWDYEKWGNRLNMKQIIEADDGEMDINQMFNMRGMVSMDTSSKNKKYSGYYTFRVISRESPAGSWIKPATQGRPITQGVVNASQKEVNKIMDAAFKRDLGV
jgi:hypothetical protein